MEIIGGVFEILGDALYGFVQVIIGLLNTLINVLPNPDPFPRLIDGLSADTAADLGFATYWLDAFIPIDWAVAALTIWASFMAASIAFCVVYWIVKTIKP